jgi:hypothetical protein
MTWPPARCTLNMTDSHAGNKLICTDIVHEPPQQHALREIPIALTACAFAAFLLLFSGPGVAAATSRRWHET